MNSTTKTSEKMSTPSKEYDEIMAFTVTLANGIGAQADEIESERRKAQLCLDRIEARTTIIHAYRAQLTLLVQRRAGMPQSKELLQMAGQCGDRQLDAFSRVDTIVGNMRQRIAAD